ncbi:MAG TPA: hypothetical protein VFU14_20285 [Acidimicrobiales bacterium]|nr:hypothetical protein [Acidimicrobiales bacterium]
MKRSALKRGKPLARGGRLERRTPLQQRSAKRIAELPERLAVIDEVERRDGRRCALVHDGRVWADDRRRMPDESFALMVALEVVPKACDGPLDPHEVIPRSAWPGGHLVASNVRLVCRRHHEWIGDHPDLAHALGFHGYSWDRPAA